MKKDHDPTPQEELEELKARRIEIGRLMRNSVFDAHDRNFAKYYWDSIALDDEILKLQDAIEPGHPPAGVVSQYSKRAASGPENRKASK